MQSPPDSVRSSRWRWCWSPRSPSSSPPSMSCRWTSWERWAPSPCSLKCQFQLWKTNFFNKSFKSYPVIINLGSFFIKMPVPIMKDQQDLLKSSSVILKLDNAWWSFFSTQCKLWRELAANPTRFKEFLCRVWKIQRDNNFLGGISDAAPHHRDHWRVHNLLLHCWVSQCFHKNDQFLHIFSKTTCLMINSEGWVPHSMDLRSKETEVHEGVLTVCYCF